jgi:hypothetical protein
MILTPLNSRQNKAPARTLNGEDNNISAKQKTMTIRANNIVIKASNKAIKANMRPSGGQRPKNDHKQRMGQQLRSRPQINAGE